MRPRDTLAENIKALTEAWPTANKHEALRRSSGIANGTLERIEKAEVSTGVDNLQALAKALDVEPWELLVPPGRRAQLRALYDALQAAAGQGQEPQDHPRKRNGTTG
jgi:transcriptional regulator with XRE-family HTH domain